MFTQQGDASQLLVAALHQVSPHHARAWPIQTPPHPHPLTLAPLLGSFQESLTPISETGGHPRRKGSSFCRK